MKRKSLSIVIACSALTAVCITSAFALNSTSEGTWSFISNDYYWQAQTQAGPILVEHLQDSDYSEIEKQLIDTSVAPDLAAAAAAAKDPDASLPDNMLPDGRVLKQNWRELESNLVANAMKIASLDNTQISVQKFQAVLPQSYGNLTLNMQKISAGDSNILIPQQPDDFPAIFSILPNGTGTAVCTEEGIWILTGIDGKMEKITPTTYNGKTYADLVKQSVETYGTNQVSWSGQISISQDSKKIAYVSNKNNLSKYSVFVSDFETKNETILSNDKNYDYFVEGWLDNNTILCYKLAEKTLDVVAITLDGKEILLDLGVDKPIIISSKNGMLAYTTPNLDEIRVVKITENTKPESILNMQLDGTIRMRSGINAFSPDSSQMAFLFVPKDKPTDRYLSILDITTGDVITNDTFPTGGNATAAVSEFSWVDNKSILTTISEKGETHKVYSTWVYSLNRGDDDV